MKVSEELQKIEAAEFGLEKTKAKEIEAAFTPMVEAMEGLQHEFEDVIKGEGSISPTPEKVEEAQDLLKKYVKVRTSSAKAHKEQKDPFLKAGKFIDGLKNAQALASAYYEESLKDIIHYDENIEKQCLIDLQIERVEEIRSFMPEASLHPDYAGMPEAIWNAYLSAAQTAKEKPKFPVEEDFKLLELFMHYIDPKFGVTIKEEHIHDFLESMDWQVFRGYIKKEN